MNNNNRLKFSSKLQILFIFHKISIRSDRFKRNYRRIDKVWKRKRKKDGEQSRAIFGRFALLECLWYLPVSLTFSSVTLFPHFFFSFSFFFLAWYQSTYRRFDRPCHTHTHTRNFASLAAHQNNEWTKFLNYCQFPFVYRDSFERHRRVLKWQAISFKSEIINVSSARLLSRYIRWMKRRDEFASRFRNFFSSEITEHAPFRGFDKF